eukprot:CAMPEP_0198290390 /NCGR_PEP_ID=MMETSP1449-20131203/8285_1 /TAXON_ID=420275 /ORGANISM="Attheya septentrionalis, Strain CCMP2084" /LENGTH=655 /DNA_ID=CAMNT_0043988895 /DNA_START=207 /DNA_END=2174 /DNA_ORIENTATION=+
MDHDDTVTTNSHNIPQVPLEEGFVDDDEESLNAIHTGQQRIQSPFQALHNKVGQSLGLLGSAASRSNEYDQVGVQYPNGTVEMERSHDHEDGFEAVDGDGGKGYMSLGRFADEGDQRGQSDTEEHHEKATIGSSVVTLLNTVAGAGMLGLPGAYAGSGFVTGTILLGIAAFFSANGLRLLAMSAKKVNAPHASFYTVASAAMPEFTMAIDLAVALKCFGVATGYFITVGDCMVDAFHFFFHQFSDPNHSLYEVLTSRQTWILTGLALVAPISFFKTLDALKFTSTLSLLLIYGLAIGIVLYAQGILDPCEGFSKHTNATNSITQYQHGAISEAEMEYQDIYYTDVEHNVSATADGMNNGTTTETCQGGEELVMGITSTLKNLSIFVFSFTCHQNVFAVVNEMERPTLRRINVVIFISIGSALVLYLVVAVEGYRTYGSHVLGDILLNYPHTAPVTLMRISIAAMVLLSYPLQLDPSRRCITSLVHSVQRVLKHRQQQRQENPVHSSFPSQTEHTVTDSSVIPLDKSSDETTDPASIASTTIELQSSNVEEVERQQQELLLNQVAEKFLFQGITCTFLVLSFMIAMVVSDLGIVLALVGATGSTMVSYILPGAIYAKLHRNDEFHAMQGLAYLQFSLGCIIVPTSLYFVIFYGASA